MASISISDVDPYEDREAVVYLDHDPVRSALYTIDRDVEKCIVANCRHLSTVWAKLCPEQYNVDWKWNGAKEPTPPGELPTLRAEIMGQRILVTRMPSTGHAHASAEWAASLGGNYHWLWQNTLELLSVWRARERAPHALTPVAWTLEVMPPVLLETSCEHSEPPLTMQAEYIVQTPDGLYTEAVDSWRRYYVRRRQPLLAWRGRAAPDWLERVGDKWQIRK